MIWHKATNRLHIKACISNVIKSCLSYFLEQILICAYTETYPYTQLTFFLPQVFICLSTLPSPRIPGQKAWYVSQNFPPTFGQRRCITFWYSMNGMGVGILRVVIKFETGGNNTLWELNRDQGNDWQFGQAPIQSPTHYKVRFFFSTNSNRANVRTFLKSVYRSISSC